MKTKKILIIDFGSQVTKLIARRIRELHVYCEIINVKKFNNLKNYKNIKGIILSGGPSTVTNKGFPKISKKIFSLNIPILGICYGLQLIAKLFGGKIKSNIKKREFGKATLIKKSNSILTNNFYINNKSDVWMSHQDGVVKIPKYFKVIASTKSVKFTSIEHKTKKIYGIQFHPEVTHTSRGKEILKNFATKICN